MSCKRTYLVFTIHIFYVILTTVHSSANVTETSLSYDASTVSSYVAPTMLSYVASTDLSNDTSSVISNDTLAGISKDIFTDTSNNISKNTSNDSYAILKDKHESLASCPFFILEPGEYELFPNGTVYVELYNLTLNATHYILTNDLVSFCVPFDDKEDEHKDYVINTSHLTLVGLGISMISLLLHLVVFSIVPDIRNLPGWNLAALCSSLFISYLLLFVISSGKAPKYPEVCIATASLTHFFLLASMLWMSIMSYDVFMTLLSATGSLRISSVQFKWKKFGIYCMWAFGIAFLFTIFSLLADILDVVPQFYRPEYGEFCWFSKKTPLLIFFAGPVIFLSCINFLFFGLSAYTIHFNKMKTDVQKNQQPVLQSRYMMYFRLSVITGATWIVGIVAAGTDADWLWYVFVVLNTFQGFFIFIAFTCSSKVKMYFREKLFGGRRGSEQTLSPTFQSYCFYANSIEKDLDKIVDNSKEKTDTIVIHL